MYLYPLLQAQPTTAYGIQQKAKGKNSVKHGEGWIRTNIPEGSSTRTDSSAPVSFAH
jgi:hypothetical protein